MLTFRLIFEGEAILSRDLDGIAERATDLRPAWPAVIAYFRQMTARAFATEGASTGKAWAPLKPSTQRERTRLHFGASHPILERYGTLKRSLTTDQGLGFVEETATSIGFGSNAKSFWYHQSRKPRKKIPRRAPVLPTAADRTELMRPVALHLRGFDPSAPVIRRSAAS